MQKEYAEKNMKNLIIVGGTGFYLKALVDGISDGLKENTNLDMSLNDAYNLLYSLDKDYMQKN